MCPMTFNVPSFTLSFRETSVKPPEIRNYNRHAHTALSVGNSDTQRSLVRPSHPVFWETLLLLADTYRNFFTDVRRSEPINLRPLARKSKATSSYISLRENMNEKLRAVLC